MNYRGNCLSMTAEAHRVVPKTRVNAQCTLIWIKYLLRSCIARARAWWSTRDWSWQGWLTPGFGSLRTLSPRCSFAPRKLAAIATAAPLTVFDAAVSALIYLKPSIDWRLKPVRGRYLEHENRAIPVRRQVRVTGRLREKQNDQVDCCCRPRLVGCNIDTSHDACADSSARRHDHASCSCLRRR